MRRLFFVAATLVSALFAPWPVTLALAMAGSVLWRGFVEGALFLALIEGAATPDRDGFAWLPLTAVALGWGGLCELVRPLLSHGDRATV